jgi:hypothetical protein
MVDMSNEDPNCETSNSEAGITLCRRHRRVTDLNLVEEITKKRLLGTNLPAVAEHLGNQVAGCYWSPDDLSPSESMEQMNAVLGLVARLAPRNELEAMLAVQAISIHNAAMECFRRAMVFDASTQIFDNYLKNAEKLCQIFISQSERLSRNRRDTCGVPNHELN